MTQTALRYWVRQAEIDEGKGPEEAMTTAEKEELTRLRRENRTLRMERDLLKKLGCLLRQGEQVKFARAEGVVAKWEGAPYQGGRTPLWQKLVLRRPDRGWRVEGQRGRVTDNAE